MTRWRTRSLLVVVCFSGLIAALPAWAAAEQTAQATAAVALPKGVERVTSVEGITEYRLASNGLKVLLFPDPTKETITVNVTYLVGSAHENYGETGMAHLLEHLVFKGSPNFPNGMGRRSYYSMEYDPYFVWGATAGMLRNLFHFLRA